VAKVAPPPPAVPFERQQAALAQHPGQPLARNEVESLRPKTEPQARPLFKSVTAPTSAEQGQTNLQVGNMQPSSRTPDSRPVSEISPEIKRNETRANAPASVFPSYSEPASNQANRPPNSGPAHEQPTKQPTHEPVSYRPTPSENGPTAQPGNSRSVQSSTAFPGPPVMPPAEQHRNVAPTPPPRTSGNPQPAESKVQTANPAPAAQKGNSPTGDAADKEKEKKK